MTQYSPDYFVFGIKELVDPERRTEIRLNANGGNSILLVCPPSQEMDFIESLRNNFEPEKFELINLDEILLEFVESKKDELPQLFDLLRGSIEQIFKAPAGEDSDDLFKLILSKIEASFLRKRVPVLIRAGVLYGTGIDNIHIMEHPLVMDSHLPLLVLYPASIEGEKLMFLSKRPASRYRCLIYKGF